MKNVIKKQMYTQFFTRQNYRMLFSRNSRPSWVTG